VAAGAPARWAIDLQQHAYCGMQLPQLEALSPEPIIERETPSERRGTHQTERDSLGTYVRFWIGADGLEKVQVMKEYFLKRVEEPAPRFLCGDAVAANT